MPAVPVSNHKGPCPIYRHNQAFEDQCNQEVVAYIPLPRELHVGMHSRHQVAEVTILVTMQQREQYEL